MRVFLCLAILVLKVSGPFNFFPKTAVSVKFILIVRDTINLLNNGANA
jgi:hypothetical protein